MAGQLTKRHSVQLPGSHWLLFANYRRTGVLQGRRSGSFYAMAGDSEHGGAAGIDPVQAIVDRAVAAAGALRRASPGQRDRALACCADRIRAGSAEILQANAADLVAAREAGIGAALEDRLRLTPARVEAMAASLEELSRTPEVVGAVLEGWRRPNGLSVRRVRVPLGVVAVVYEARPNVTAEAAGIALRSANAIVLRGSSSASRSNSAIAAALGRALEDVGLPSQCVSLVGGAGHGRVVELLHTKGVDCLIPRGGPALLDLVRTEAVMPVVVDGSGNCHIFVDANADLDLAASVVVNAKCSRPGVCNAAEKLLVHSDIASKFLPIVQDALVGVELRADPRAAGYLVSAIPAEEEDWGREYLDLIMAVKVVDDVDEAIAHIAKFGSGHSEAVLSQDVSVINRFVSEVDAAAVVVNTSTRFIDGSELGFGGEIGISTQKLHVRGPMGPDALTCIKLVVEGEGQVRG